MIDRSTALAVLAGALFVIGIVAFLAQELLFAGLCFLALSFTIYYRETRG